MDGMGGCGMGGCGVGGWGVEGCGVAMEGSGSPWSSVLSSAGVYSPAKGWKDLAIDPIVSSIALEKLASRTGDSSAGDSEITVRTILAVPLAWIKVLSRMVVCFCMEKDVWLF